MRRSRPWLPKEIQLAGHPARLGRREDVIEGGLGVGAEVVEDDPHDLGVRVDLVGLPQHAAGKVLLDDGGRGRIPRGSGRPFGRS